MLLWSISILTATIVAQPPAQSLKAANKAYQEKDYRQAVREYENILAKGQHSEAVYYNLGNAYFRLEEFGPAILNYQRALRLGPKDQHTLHNLELAQAQLPQQVIKIEQSGVVKAWLSVQNTLSTQAWSIIGLIILWLGAILLGLWLLHPLNRVKKLSLASGVLLLFLCLLPFLLAYGRSQEEFYSTKAVVMTERAQLRAAPEEDSKAVMPLYEGITVEILDELGAWNKVRLEDTTEGWLPMDILEKV